MVCIGYAGIEAFDIILYIGKTLAKLHLPVLIIDLSDSGALTKVIYHGMDIDSSDTIVNYRSLNYVRTIPHEKELDEFNNGVVFLNFGLNYVDSIPFNIDTMNIVVNPLPSMIDRVKVFLDRMEYDNSRVRLLIRDLISIDDIDRVKRSISDADTWISCDYLYLELIDYENSISCQVKQVIKFKKISKRMKKFIISEVGNILPNIKPFRIRKAFFLARKKGGR